MGCYNGTCMLSNLPIIFGDPVVCIPLHQNIFHSSHRGVGGGGYCEPTAYWQPALLPFRGKYNDYGFVDQIIYAPDKMRNNQIKSDMFDALISKVLITDRGRLIGGMGWKPHPHRDELDREEVPTPIEKKFWKENNLDDIINLQSELIYVHTFKSDKAKYSGVVGFCLMHEEIYEEAIREYFPKKEFISEFIGLLSNVDPESKPKSEFDGPVSKMLNTKANEFLKKYDRENSTYYSQYFWHFAIKMMEQSGKVGTVAELCEKAIARNPKILVPLIFELQAIEAFIWSTRRLICPQSGAGSQSTNYGAYLGVMKKAIELCERKEKEEKK